MKTQAPRVVAMGDSVTLGVGDGVHVPDGNSGWAAHVAGCLGASHFTNIAANGVRVRHVMESQVPTALMQRPDVVLMTVGGNDVLRGDFSPTEITDRLSLVLDRIERPGREVVLVGLDRIGLFGIVGPRVARVMGARIDRANDALRLACAGRRVHLIDGAAVFAGVGEQAWHVDRIHPSQVGHRALAASAVAALAGAWPQVAEPAEPRPMPGLASRVTWLAVHGAPWLAKRSRDLIPQVATVVGQELRAEKRGRAIVAAQAQSSATPTRVAS